MYFIVYTKPMGYFNARVRTIKVPLHIRKALRDHNTRLTGDKILFVQD